MSVGQKISTFRKIKSIDHMAFAEEVQQFNSLLTSIALTLMTMSYRKHLTYT